MGVLAKSSNTRWDSFWEAKQTAPRQEDKHIQVNNGWIEVTLEKGILRSGVYRSEFRTKILNPYYDFKIGFVMMLGTDHKSNGSAVTFQVWDGGSPSNSLRWDYNTNKVYHKMYGDNPRMRKDTPLGNNNTNFLKPVEFQIEFKGTTNNSGYIRFVVDGKETVIEGRNLFDNVDSGGYIKFGLYDDDVKDWPSNLNERKIFFKDIVIATRDTSDSEMGWTDTGGGNEPDTPDEPSKPDEPGKPKEPDTPTRPIDLSDINECIGNINFWFERLKSRIENLDK